MFGGGRGGAAESNLRTGLRKEGQMFSELPIGPFRPQNVTTTDYHFTNTTRAFVKVHLLFCLFSVEGFSLFHRVVTADVWREGAAVRRHEAAIFDFIVEIKVFKFPTTNVANTEIETHFREFLPHLESESSNSL